MRWIRITPEGLFYMGTTVALGVAALVTANNILYLLVSLLLSGLGFSGYLSWRTIRDLEIDISRGSASAGSVARDQILFKNKSSRPLYLIDVYEVNSAGLERVAKIQYLAPRQELWVPTQQSFQRRGRHYWRGYSVGTAMPFGFAIKYYPRESKGERWIWPERKKKKISPAEFEQSDRARSPFVPRQRTEGEIRNWAEGDDLRAVVWTLSAKGQGWFVRPDRGDESEDDVVLDLCQPAGVKFESHVVDSAQPFYRALSGGMSPRLILLGAAGKKIVRGARKALDELAQVQPEGRS